jgi:hypothetical protein
MSVQLEPKFSAWRPWRLGGSFSRVGSAAPVPVFPAGVVAQGDLLTARKILRFELRFGSPRCDQSLEWQPQGTNISAVVRQPPDTLIEIVNRDIRGVNGGQRRARRFVSEARGKRDFRAESGCARPLRGAFRASRLLARWLLGSCLPLRSNKESACA